MEFFIGMISGLALAVAVSSMYIFLSRKAVFVIAMGILCSITALVLWIIALPIAAFVYHVRTINVWSSLLFANTIFFAIGIVVMSKFWEILAEKIAEEQHEEVEKLDAQVPSS